MEMTRDIWDGHDYLPRVFDEWLSDAGATFQAAEVDGLVVGVHRVRPYAPGLAWYEGLRVASTHRRQGIARAMLEAAVDGARQQGFREMRLATGNVDAASLFESAGFHRVADVRWWRGSRVEGGEPARMPGEAEVARLWPSLSRAPGAELYAGGIPDFNGSRNLDQAEVLRLAREGHLRIGPGGRAAAGLRNAWGDNIAVALLLGQGAAMRELLMALRFEADADGLDHVTVGLPRGHPAEEDLRATGYDFANDEDTAYIYALKL